MINDATKHCLRQGEREKIANGYAIPSLSKELNVVSAEEAISY